MTMMNEKVTFDFGGGLPAPSFSLDGLNTMGVSQEFDIRETLDLLERINKLKVKNNLYKWFQKGSGTGLDDLPKHKSFFEAGNDYKERYFSASNRTGKTISGAYETACHATGIYVEDWPGKRFDKPIEAWVMGKTKETTRDVLQKELVGSVDNPGTGMIPAHLIKKIVYRPNSGGAIDYILVESVSGGQSRIGFKSYEQGIDSLMGVMLDVVWMDELPPADIYSECYTRTMTTNGIIYVTATPLAGLTPFVLSFYNNSDFLPKGSDVPGVVALTKDDMEREMDDKLKSGDIDILEYEEYKKSLGFTTKFKATVIAGWDDAPWLDEDSKKRMLEATPPHLRAARSTGLPSMGSGSVFTTPLEDILIKDFEIPSHWKHVAGMDVGWNNTAGCWIAINPDTDEAYIYSEYKKGQAEAPVHAAAFKLRGDWININIDPASRGRSQADGKQLFSLYQKAGLRIVEADNGVEAGIHELQQAFATGQLKVFKSCTEFQKEYVTYRRAENGKIIKENDHELDTVRYAWKGRKYARVKPTPNRNRNKTGGTFSGKQYDI